MSLQHYMVLFFGVLTQRRVLSVCIVTHVGVRNAEYVERSFNEVKIVEINPQNN